MDFIYSTSTSSLLLIFFSLFLFLFYSRVKNNKQQTHPFSTCHIPQSSSSNSLTISTTIQPKYDVFLSFRGEDVRNNFVSHLKVALHRKGIKRFIDDDLISGEQISPSLLEAIQQSTISIIVFSKNYASSKWCLSELVKILECKRLNEQIVMPIFYHVDPSDVRKQAGSYAKAFKQHKRTLKDGKENIQRWKDALTEAANLSGWDLHNREEAEFIDEITHDILKKLNRITSFDAYGLVGIETRVERIESSLYVGSADVLFLGIWGMGGIGKTTVAKVLFHKIKYQFDSCCFLENIREYQKKHGVQHLQEKILSKVLQERDFSMDISDGFYKNRLCGQKVLIVLDDINDVEQLERLAGAHHWFGSGSKIIITTRDKQVLTGADIVYKAEHLIYEEALLLFCHHAFRKNHPQEDYLGLSRKFVNYADGVPLALKVLGSSLCGKDKQTWESEWAKLERFPNEKVERVLELSFEGLDETSKKILLDVACFFKGDNVDIARAMWDGCGFFPNVGISVLKDKCLLEIRNQSELWMHDLIECMCKAIVDKENINEPGKRSRLWRHEDICHILKKNTASEAVECIIFDLSKTKEVIELDEDAFMNMTNLRSLKFFYSHSCGSTKISLPRGLSMLPDTLRYLFWDGYPYKFLPSNFDTQNLVGLSLPHSCIRRLWKEHKVFKHLKLINFRNSKYLFEVPDLSGAQNLEDINFENCTELSKVHPSIFTLSNLICLVLANCRKLQSLPSSSYWKSSLRTLNLSDCSNLQNIPDSICDLKSLEELNLVKCSNLQNIPDNISNLKCLRRLDLTFCSNLQNIPEIFDYMENLYYLSLVGTAVSSLPSSIENLTGLVELNLSHCKKLTSLPNSICNLKHLQKLLCRSCKMLQNLPENIGNLESLKELYVNESSIKHVPASIACLKNIKKLSFRGCRGKSPSCMGLQLPPLLDLQYLWNLDLGNCDLVELPSGLDSCCSLTHLDLSGNNFESLPQTISNIPNLSVLELNCCKRLGSLPKLPSSLRFLSVDDCTLLESVRSLEELYSSMYTNIERVPESISCVRGIFSFNNCLKLKKQWNSITESVIQMLPHFGKVLRFIPPESLKYDMFLGWTSLAVVFPGSAIPEWFSNQSMSNTITLQLPPKFPTNLLGFAVCVIVSPTDISHIKDVYVDFKINVRFVINNEYTDSQFSNRLFYTYREIIKLCFKEDHLVVGFAPSFEFFYLSSKVGPNDCNYVEAVLEFHEKTLVEGVHLKVKKWAVGLVNVEE